MSSDEKVSILSWIMLCVMLLGLLTGGLMIDHRVDALEDKSELNAARIDSLIGCQFRCLEYQNLQGQALIDVGRRINDHMDVTDLARQEVWAAEAETLQCDTVYGDTLYLGTWQTLIDSAGGQ